MICHHGRERWDDTVRGTHVSVEEEESLLRFTQKQVYFVGDIAAVTISHLGGRARLFWCRPVTVHNVQNRCKENPLDRQSERMLRLQRCPW